VTWDFEGANVIYFPNQEEGRYDGDIFQLFEDLLYKDITLVLYVKTENVMDRENVLIAWNHNGTNVKCTFEGVYVLGVSNLLKNLLYEDIPIEFHVMAHKIILTQYDIC
jgi:hypothetical protein